MTRARVPIALDVTVDYAAWKKAVPSPARLCRAAANQALKVARVRRTPAVTLELISDRRMQRLNREFRGFDKPTNVLAFPSGDDTGFLGDIAIAFETVRREAKGDQKSIRAHLAHLVVHGVLHLIGYHHDDSTAAERMENLERRALSGMGIADPYAPALDTPRRDTPKRSAR
jgi:probable rRNA maturation factor